MPIQNPQTNWGQTSGNEDFIREAARKEHVRERQKFDRESISQGLEYDPKASTRSEEDYNARNFGFDPGRRIPVRPPTPPVAGSWDPLTGEPHADPQYEARLENWKRYQRDREIRGGEPATKVYSAPIGPMFGPQRRRPQPPG